MTAMFQTSAKKKLLKELGEYYRGELPEKDKELFILDLAFRELRRKLKEKATVSNLTEEEKEDVVRLMNQLRSCNYTVREYICELHHFRHWKGSQEYDKWFFKMQAMFFRGGDDWDKKMMAVMNDMKYLFAKRTRTYNLLKKWKF